MTIDVGVDTIHALEDLTNHGGEGFGEWYAWSILVTSGTNSELCGIPILLGKTASLSMLL